MRTVQLARDAYAKIILHAARFPSSGVNGILLGTPIDASTAGSSKRDFKVTDAIPLFHSQLNLAPMLEFALHAVYAYAQKHQLSIVGYYQASETIGSGSITGLAQVVGDRIRALFPDAVVFMVDNRSIDHQEGNLALNPFIHTGSAWRQEAESSNELRLSPIDPETPKFVVDHIKRKTFRDIVDFQTHLEDVSLDWLNPKLFS
ncbi:hypothetical protein CAOG_02391 [Capsaspora owczarzaki ATCC 30864]|nr:hypothetical protein CAOG_02391 [Capsaspora owczarzaki ATCC 30864]|eukprot:XP_004349141.1 hypothetical protein CAOG_02391 [Capsaspora owczarzaki ATCC 30864]